jgi:hypothetical protein
MSAIRASAQVAKIVLAYGPHGWHIVIAFTLALACAISASHDGVTTGRCPGGGDRCVIEVCVTLPGGCPCAAERLSFQLAE